jgi:hypothetical protein
MLIRKFAGLIALCASFAAGAQCTKDTDCRDPRICERGACVYPGAAKEAGAAGAVPDQIKLTVSDGGQERWIMFDRAGERVTRSPGLETLGSASGTMYLAEGAQIRVTTTLAGGAVPDGHRLRVYWQGYPRDEDVCVATSGAECTFVRQLHTLRQSPNHPIVCAGMDYVSGGTNRGLGAVCITLFLGKAAPVRGAVPNQIRLAVSEARNETWIQYDRNGERVTRSPNLERLGTHSGTMVLPQGAALKISASLLDGAVPAGHRLRVYWQGYPKDADLCATTSGADCSAARQLHTLRQSPNHPIVCATMDYIGGGSNQGLAAVCITLFPK